MKSSFYDGVYGCLIGHTIGDALGAPGETRNYWEIRERYGKVDRFLPSEIGNTTGRPGEGTDDTTLRHYVPLAMLHYAQGDPDLAMIEAARYGRDCDTIAAMAGCLGGALAGAHAIRSDWIETAERANQELYSFLEGDRSLDHAAMARRLVEAYRQEVGRRQSGVTVMERILAQNG
jgi:ADP-ribosylglycohydrolase